MSSTQGHTNINTVHTTLDISVLLGEINRIADESYSEGFESGYDVGVKKGKADGAREFAEKIKSEIEKYWYRSELDMGADNVNCLIDEVIKELKAEVSE